MHAKWEGHTVLYFKTRTKYRTTTNKGSKPKQEINNYRTTALEREKPKPLGGLNVFYWYQAVALDSVTAKAQNLFSLHGDFLTIVMYSNVSSQRNNLIKSTHYDETKKRTHDTQIVRAKENLTLSHGGPSQRQASGANRLIKSLCQGRQWVWGLTHSRAIKEETIAMNRDLV